ncbi:MAG: YciI family protein [Polyangia bacterium]
MQYVLLIYGNEETWNQLSEAEKGKVSVEMGRFAQELGQSGKLRGGNPLQPVATATTVRMKNGKSLITDGPFAETKEQLGGYMLIEAANLDEALAIVARMPAASPHVAIEIRPITEVPA